MSGRVLWAVLLAPALCAAPQRIVSTSPSITEILYALGLGDRVVGVTIHCHYPPEALKKPKVGTYQTPDVETILRLAPDLVVTQRSPVSVSGQLRNLHVNVLELEQEDLGSIYRSIERLSHAAGVDERGNALTGSLRAQLDAVRKRTSGLSRRRMMFVVGRTPQAVEDLIVAGRASYLNEVIEIAGGDNIFRRAVAAYPKVSLEEVMARDPEVIVDMGEMAETVGITEERKQAVVALWQHYPMLAAVKQRRVFAVASDIYVVPGPRVAEAARAFARMLHPETNR